MAERSLLMFVGYAVDCKNEQLWQGEQVLRLTNKAFAVLRYLVEHPGQLVTKDALFAAVWPVSIVSESTLTNCIGEVRRALGDAAKRPRFIETVQRRGYRFIAPVTASTDPVRSPTLNVQGFSPPPAAENPRGASSSSQLETLNLKPGTLLVGREAELMQLHSVLAKVQNGQRQVVFVTGEAGMGKTSLVETFVRSLTSQDVYRPSSTVHRQNTGIRSEELSEVQRQKFSIRNPQPVTTIPTVVLGWGQCVEQYGAGEAYLPVLESLGRLGRGPQKAPVLTVLHQYAPTWLAQLPALLSPEELQAVQQRIQGATRERMLREIVEALDALSTEHPLLLVLEDLHWSDSSTVELLGTIVRRRESARLLVIGTYRAAELAVMNHPLKTVKHELIARGCASEVALSFLSSASVREYVGQRLAEYETADSLANFVYQRTEGQPLFMVQVTEYVARQLESSVFKAAGTRDLVIPQGLHELIGAQLGRLTEDEQTVLAVSSVVGAEFTAASVAAGMAMAEAAIEAVCERLARRGQFIEERGVRTWPDGTVSAHFGFRHALYQEILYARIPEARRVRLHKATGEWLASRYGERASEIAAELAVHFERGWDKDRAAVSLQQAGENALRRYAYPEALEHFQKAAEFLQTLVPTADRARRELALQFLLIQALVAVKGHASVEVAHAYRYARTLCEKVGTTQQLFFVLLGLVRLYHGHCEYQQARDLSMQCLALARREHDPAFFFPAYYLLGASELYLGNFAVAENYLTQGIQSYDTRHDATYVASYGYGTAGPYTSCLGYAATTLWFLGYPDQALQGTAEMLRIAKEYASPLTLTGARVFAPLVYHCCRQGGHVQEQAEEGIAVATRMGFPFWRAISLFWRGWGLAEQGHYEEGIKQMRQGLTAQRETGSSVHQVHFTILLAEAHGRAGQCEEGLHLLDEAETQMEKTDERFYEAELHRLKGELTLQQFKVQGSKFQVEQSPRSKVQGPKSSKTKSQILNPKSQEGAEACFLKAIDVARRQQAKSLELRAVMSLVRLCQQQGLGPGVRTTQRKTHTALTEAHQMLSEVYGWFTEGFNTKDLQEAKALLEKGAGRKGGVVTDEARASLAK